MRLAVIHALRHIRSTLVATAGVEGFGGGYNFLELVVQYRSLFAGFVSVREEPVYPGADRNSEINGEK